jgi:electron transfer flavoprotein alpha subunit
MTVLILAQHNNKSIHPSSLSTVTAATHLGKDVHMLIAGYKCDNVARSACLITGVNKVLHVDAIHYEHFLAEELTPLVVELTKEETYTHILAPATSFGKNILPRIAALLDVQQISNVSEIIDENTFVQPVYTGNALATVRSKSKLKILTIRTTVFDEAPLSVENSASIECIPPIPAVKQSRFIQREIIETERPNLTAAKIVVAGGRALGSKESFKMLETLADKLGGAIGATRAAVDAGYIPNDSQIGQTGKIIAPDLYIGIGLSGAVQHTSGLRDTKIIVAINTDEKAPICEMADYTLIADLFDALPELIEKL